LIRENLNITRDSWKPSGKRLKGPVLRQGKGREKDAERGGEKKKKED